MQARDAAAACASFAPGTLVVEGHSQYRGEVAVRHWVEERTSSRQEPIQPIHVVRRERVTLLSTVTRQALDRGERAVASFLDWQFTTSGDKISALTIGAAQLPELPAPIAAYVQASNALDLDGLVAAFSDDALVNDQLREYWGKGAIEEWAAREIISQQLTMYVRAVVVHHDHTIVTANVDGDFDKRGLPEPLVLAFYFSTRESKIIQLLILRNQPDDG